MEKDSCPGVSSAFPRRFLLPIALYESKGLIFELYYGGRSLADADAVNYRPRQRFSVLTGGQPFTRHEIRWVHLSPTADPDDNTLPNRDPRNGNQ